MIQKLHHANRMLAIDPTPRGFGFAVFEGNQLIDWGLCQVGKEKNANVLKRASRLHRRFQPDLLVLEDHRARGSRRRNRIQHLLARIAALAASNKSPVALISATTVRRTFRKFDARNKDQIAAKITEWFPELRPRLPKPRKPWMSEDERMGIFDAAALVVSMLDLK